MAGKSSDANSPILSWHRNLLLAGAVFTVLLIAMGGILCVTQSIRNCPDWPGCFGRIVPPAEPGPILEYTHRLLAGVSGLLILGSAVVSMLRVPQLRWISIPPLVAIVLLVEVSFFGAQVVLRGLAPGWAAVDVGSALLVVALMVTAAVKAMSIKNDPSQPDRLSFKNPFTRLVLVTTAMVYMVYVSGILVAGKGSITSCLGWPIYRLQQFQVDGLTWWNILRLTISLLGVGMLVMVLVQAWRKRGELPGVFRAARLVGLAVVLEAVAQALLQLFGLQTPLLVVYTVVAAALWALLVALLIRAGLQAEVG